MGLRHSLQQISSSLLPINPLPLIELQELLDKGGSVGGEFPTSAAIFAQLRRVAAQSDFSVPLLSEIIRDDPMLAPRLIATANSSAYLRGKAAETVEQALLITGPKRCLTLIEEVAPIREYRDVYAGRAVSLGALQEQLLTVIASREIAQLYENAVANTVDWASYCANTLQLGPTLLAYLKPHLYSACRLDGVKPDTSFRKCFESLVGRTQVFQAVSLAKRLSYPEEVLMAMLALERPVWSNREYKSGRDKLWATLAASVSFGAEISYEISKNSGVNKLEALIKEYSGKLGLKRTAVEKIVGNLPALLYTHCMRIGVVPLALPYYLEHFQRDDSLTEPPSNATDRLTPFIVELKVCTQYVPRDNEPSRFPQAILSTAQALLRALAFDRVVIFEFSPERNKLLPAFTMGAETDLAALRERRMEGNGSDARAAREKKIVFAGSPVFEDGWPAIAFPIVQLGSVEGVIYADKLNRPGTTSFTPQEQMACVALAEMWFDVSSHLG